MKLYLLLAILLCPIVFFAQNQQTYSQKIETESQETILITIDKNDIDLRYWKGEYILVDSLLTFNEEFAPLVEEMLEMGAFNLNTTVDEEEGLVLKAMMKNEELAYQPKEPKNKISYTVYLPKSIEKVFWKSPIPATER